MVAASSDGVSYIVTVKGMTELTTGASFVMIPGVTSTSTEATIDVNNLGAKPILRKLSNADNAAQPGYADNWLCADVPLRLIYDSSVESGCWIAEGCNKPFGGDIYGDVPSAVKDSAGQQITTTYLKDMSVSASDITYTKGDGTTVNASLSALIQFVLPKVTTVTMSTTWNTDGGRYYQNIPLTCVTANSIVNLQPTQEQIYEWTKNGLVLSTKSGDGYFTLYLSGTKPSEDVDIQVTVQEVVRI